MLFSRAKRPKPKTKPEELVIPKQNIQELATKGITTLHPKYGEHLDSGSTIRVHHLGNNQNPITVTVKRSLLKSIRRGGKVRTLHLNTGGTDDTHSWSA